jgi:hypothetical protein
VDWSFDLHMGNDQLLSYVFHSNPIDSSCASRSRMSSLDKKCDDQVLISASLFLSDLDFNGVRQ